MAILSKQKINAVDDYQRVEVEIPEWGGSVYLKGFSIPETIAFNLEYPGWDDQEYAVVYLAYAMVDDMGRRIFTSEDDIKELAKRNPEVLGRLYLQATRLNTEDTKAVDTEKHSSTVLPGGNSDGGAVSPESVRSDEKSDPEGNEPVA